MQTIIIIIISVKSTAPNTAAKVIAAIHPPLSFSQSSIGQELAELLSGIVILQ